MYVANEFSVAGHETTSTATTWALYALSLHPDIQTKLREELFTLDSEAPDMDDLKTLTYLDWVVRETLRVHAPVPNAMRVATQDDVLPMEDGSTLRYVIRSLQNNGIFNIFLELRKVIGFISLFWR